MTTPQTPSQIAERVFPLVDAGDWDQIPSLLDPKSVWEFYEGELESARSTEKHAVPRTAEDFRRSQPDLPEEVANYYAEQSAKHGVERSPLKEEFGVESVEELEALAPSAAVATVMRARDIRSRVHGYVLAQHPEYLGEAFGIPTCASTTIITSLACANN